MHEAILAAGGPHAAAPHGRLRWRGLGRLRHEGGAAATALMALTAGDERACDMMLQADGAKVGMCLPVLCPPCPALHWRTQCAAGTAAVLLQAALSGAPLPPLTALAALQAPPACVSWPPRR